MSKQQALLVSMSERNLDAREAENELLQLHFCLNIELQVGVVVSNKIGCIFREAAFIGT